MCLVPFSYPSSFDPWWLCTLLQNETLYERPPTRGVCCQFFALSLPVVAAQFPVLTPPLLILSQLETYWSTHEMDPETHALTFAEFITMVTSGVFSLPYPKDVTDAMLQLVTEEGAGTPSPTRARRESEILEDIERHKVNGLRKTIAHVLRMRMQGPVGAALHEMRVNMSHDGHTQANACLKYCFGTAAF